MKIPQSPPDDQELSEHIAGVPIGALSAAISQGPSPGDKYRHWETHRRCEPPNGLSVEAGWWALKMARRSQARRIPDLQGMDGNVFWYAMPDPLVRMLSRADRALTGQVFGQSIGAHKDQYLIRSVIEEAITSSQLEGAAVTRVVAKEMLRTGRPPVNTYERMIVNNYRALLKVRSFAHEPLSVELINELRDELVIGTLEPDQIGRFRQQNDGIGVWDEGSNRLLFTPPPAGESRDRLDQLVAFANRTPEEDSSYMHPVLKAITLHFWLAYIHPYTDGNGRTARAVFYWYMIRSGYWMAEYISISRIIKQAPAAYGKSFLYTETDENDLTYFFLSQLKVLGLAIGDLEAYIEKKARETQEAGALLGPAMPLNHRQKAVIGHALRNPRATYTIASHRGSHGVTYQTARTDLLEMRDLGLLSTTKNGRTLLFSPVSNISQVLRSISPITD
ncbi:MAG: Fic family protein [Thalassolituus oleivorans]|jgi:Fic family protein